MSGLLYPIGDWQAQAGRGWEGGGEGSVLEGISLASREKRGACHPEAGAARRGISRMLCWVQLL